VITVFGSTNLDQVGTVVRIPRQGETVAGIGFAMAPGGKGANQALAARRAGADVRHVSAVGRDGFADLALALLRGSGVDLSGVKITDQGTGIAMIMVDAAGENIIAAIPGANALVDADDAQSALAHADGGILLVQQEVPQPATRRALELARQQGMTSILNTAPYLDDTAGLAPLADIVVANETEFALMTGHAEGGRDTAMRDWTSRHARIIIVTLGGDGARAASVDGGFIEVPAMPVVPVDTVGAGDTFCGYLAAGLDAGMPLEAAMRRAARAASIACLKPGAQPAIPLAAEVDAAAS
jgi:ribokinase